MANKIQLGNVEHIGVIVKDVNKAIEHYERLGIGPCRHLSATYQMREMWGKPIPNDVVTGKHARVELGPSLFIELIEPVAEGTFWMDFLKTKGEGMQHLAYRVEDIEKTEAELIAVGFDIIYRSRLSFPDGSFSRGAYADTGKTGGVPIEIFQRGHV
jgi:methylmalonyl-CoA/ethylmalonyl-CoA epimerase